MTHVLVSPLSIGLESPDFLPRLCLREWKANLGTFLFIRRVELSPFVIYPPLPLSYLTPGLPGSLWDFSFVGDVIPTHAFKFLINGFVFLFFSSHARSKIMLDDSSFSTIHVVRCLCVQFKKNGVSLRHVKVCCDRHGQVLRLST